MQPDAPDDWLALDKLGHLILCVGVTCSVHTALRFAAAVRPAPALAVGTAASLVVAGVKELGDYLAWWPGRLSDKDFAADLAGTLLGIAAVASAERWRAVRAQQRQQQQYQRVPLQRLEADVEMGLSAPGV